MITKRFVLSFIAFILIFTIIFVGLTGFIGRFAYTPDDSSTEKAVKEDFGVPETWLARYGVELNNFIDAKRDDDNDGLTLVQEYEYHTDPTNPDTDGDGYDDGTEVANGYRPDGAGIMDTNKNDIPDKWEKDYFGALIADIMDDTDHDGLTQRDEYLFGTDPANPDTDGDGYDDGTEVAHGYDPDAPGEARPKVFIVIDKIGIDVPVVLSKNSDEASLQKDLEKGVIHYPKTAMPGQRGNMYIAGHSSNYSWAKGTYNYVFKRLNELENGDKIIVKVKFHNGNELAYTYVVTTKEEVAPDDERIFADTQSQQLTLTTCWPLGTNFRRLMVKAQLVENDA